MLQQSKLKVVIRGLSPLLQNNPIRMGAGDGNTKVKQTKPDKNIEAESTTYRDANGSLYIPSSAVFGCMLNAAMDLKVRGSRKSLGAILKGAILGISDANGTPRQITVRDLNGNPQTEIDVYSARCVIQRAGVVKHRAMINEWRLEFIIKFAREYVQQSGFLIDALERGGILVGIGDYRPEKKGEFGRFEVVSFEEI